jgi:hypothetical protein
MTKDQLFSKLKELNFPKGEYVVTGSGILGALGLREVNDVDIAVTPHLLASLQSTGEWTEEIRYNKIFLMKDDVDIASQLSWEDYATTTEEAIQSATMIDGFPFLNLEETIKFKQAMGREKDFHDIELIKTLKL